MEKAIHRLSEINREAKTAICSVCGPVKVRGKGARRCMCINKSREIHSRRHKERHDSDIEYREKRRVCSRNHDRIVRAIVINRYSPKWVCARCGYSDYPGLEIDHINRQDKRGRTDVGGRLYARIIREGFPPHFRVLCGGCQKVVEAIRKGLYAETKAWVIPQ